MSGPSRYDPVLIGVDWGTSNLRVMRIGDGGAILDSRSDQRGASRLAADDFPVVLNEIAADWMDGDTPVLVCGMAGARGKWRETGYRDCPSDLDDLAPVRAGEDAAIRIVPGVSLSNDAGLTDVMRGEETQVMGIYLEARPELVVTPGTHSKWIHIEGARIRDFRTFMTGELFSAIRAGTILGQGMGDPGVDDSAFGTGVRRALADSGLSALLFSVRVERLADRLPAASAADYLSGLLIGAEIAGQGVPDGRKVTVIGAPSLTARYALALSLAGFSEVQVLDGTTATAKGLWRIHEAHRA